MYRIIQEYRPDGATLPDKPSDLLELALNDAKRLNRSRRYQMDPGEYHQRARRRKDGKCGVCLAGEVMARTLKAPIRADCAPNSMAADERMLRGKLQAIDFARKGEVADAVLSARGEPP